MSIKPQPKYLTVIKDVPPPPCWPPPQAPESPAPSQKPPERADKQKYIITNKTKGEKKYSAVYFSNVSLLMLRLRE